MVYGVRVRGAVVLNTLQTLLPTQTKIISQVPLVGASVPPRPTELPLYQIVDGGGNGSVPIVIDQVEVPAVEI